MLVPVSVPNPINTPTPLIPRLPSNSSSHSTSSKTAPPSPSKEKKAEAPRATPIIDRTQLGLKLNQNGLTLSETGLSDLIRLVSNCFETYNKSRFENPKKQNHPHLPKAHIFYSHSRKRLRVYLKGSAERRVLGGFKSFIPSTCIQFSTTVAPIIEKVTRLTLQAKHVKNHVDRMEDTDRLLQQFSSPLICSNRDFEIYEGKNAKTKVVAYQSLFQKPLKKITLPADAENKRLLFKNIFKQALTGLKLIHEKQIVHQDIKPENIVINEQPDFSLAYIDFDLYFYLRDAGTKHRESGTARYFSPEHFKASLPFGQAIDIWALGSVFHWLLNDKKRPVWSIGTETAGSLNLFIAKMKKTLELRNSSSSSSSSSTVSSQPDSSTRSTIEAQFNPILTLANIIVSEIRSENPLFIPENELMIDRLVPKMRELNQKICDLIKESVLFKQVDTTELNRYIEQLNELKELLIHQLQLSWAHLEHNHSHRFTNDILKNIVHSMLHPDPRLRITAASALQILLDDENTYLSTPPLSSHLVTPPSSHYLQFGTPMRLKRKYSAINHENQQPNNKSPLKRILSSSKKMKSAGKEELKATPIKSKDNQENQDLVRKISFPLFALVKAAQKKDEV